MYTVTLVQVLGMVGKVLIVSTSLHLAKKFGLCKAEEFLWFIWECIVQLLPFSTRLLVVVMSSCPLPSHALVDDERAPLYARRASRGSYFPSATTTVSFALVLLPSQSRTFPRTPNIYTPGLAVFPNGLAVGARYKG